MQTSEIRFGGVVLGLFVLALTGGGPSPAHAADGGRAAPSQKGEARRSKNPAQVRLEAAVKLLRSEQYEQAVVDLARFVATERTHRIEARYHLGKALYRMDLLHSALSQFERILAKGPKGRFYDASLEWCLFIGRKMVADHAVNEVVARYAQGGFPKPYRDEFRFRLARFHYARALAIETGEAASRLGEAEVKETRTGGISIRGDLFGEKDPFGEDAAPPPPPTRDVVSARKKRGGGLSFDEDLFGDPVERKPKPVKPPKKKKRRRTSAQETALTSQEHTEAAVRFVKRVGVESEFGSRSRFLEALLLYKQGKENEALEAFKTVVRMTRKRDDPEASALREAAFFQLARAHYGAQQPTFSRFYYRKVDRDSLQWLDALYEASWASFRLGDFEKALGNLLTVHAPFFDGVYLPESHILKAVIYYENCRYVEAKDILTEFLARHEPVLQELKKMTAEAQSAERYYEMLANLRSPDFAQADRRKAQTLARVLEIALADPELERLDASYREVEQERERIMDLRGPLSTSPFKKQVLVHLARVQKSLGQNAGRAVKNQLEREKVQIKELVQQAIRINIETSRSEQERIESQLREVQSRPKRVTREFVEWTDDEKVVWPFDGEYWRDELGTYEITLAHSCR